MGSKRGKVIIPAIRQTASAFSCTAGCFGLNTFSHDMHGPLLPACLLTAYIFFVCVCVIYLFPRKTNTEPLKIEHKVV